MYRLPFILFCLTLILVTACKPTTTPTVETDEDAKALQWPVWVTNGNIYEVNIRQYTPEGTINAFAQHLPRLKDMGVEILWLMPIYPISTTKRKGGLGSYYAVSDFTEVNPEFGTKEDVKNLIAKAHNLGLKVILDWVPNHTGWDHVWISEHPEYYTKGKDGDITEPINPDNGEPYGWSDVADLNYDSEGLRANMLKDMLYWIREFDVDGFRYDIAFGVPLDFWHNLTPQLLKEKPDLFLLSESEETDHVNKGTHHTIYGWSFHHLMNDIAKGEKTAKDIDAWRAESAKITHGQQMLFTSNHDENSWNGSAIERMGSGANAFAVLAATMEGMPLIYSGQEEPLTKRLAFFEKDTIGFENYANADFYKMILGLKKRNKALSSGTGIETDFRKLGESDAIYAFTRERDGDKVAVAINLTDKKAEITFNRELRGMTNVMTATEVSIPAGSVKSLGPWEYYIASNR